MLQEHESKQLRVERHSLKIGLDAANITISRLENESELSKQQIKLQSEYEAKNGDLNDGGNMTYQEENKVFMSL